jgi:hypothetical protein
MRELTFGVSAWAWFTPETDVMRAGRSGRFASAGSDSKVLSLPPAERRRLNPLTQLALRVGEELAAGRERSILAETPLVYGSSDGDGVVLMKLLGALRDHQPLSPTQFHNSVHNAPAGYWTIGLSSQAAATAIAADDDTIEVALVEGGMQAVVRGGPVLMLAASRSFPDELRRARPELQDFAVGAWCEPTAGPGAWRCTLTVSASELAAESVVDTSLEASIRSYGEAGLQCRRWVRHLGGELCLERNPP